MEQTNFLLKTFLRFCSKRKVFLLINSFLLILWLLGLTGAVTTVTITAYRNNYQIFLDGKLLGEARGIGSSGGGISVSLNHPESLPSPFPLHGEVLRIKVTDPKGNTLYDRKGSTTGRQDREDFKAEIKLKNALSAEIKFQEQDDKNYLEFFYRVFRERDYSLNKYINGERQEIFRQWRALEFNLFQSLKLILAVAFREYPLVLGFYLLAVLIRRLPERLKPANFPVPPKSFGTVQKLFEKGIRFLPYALLLGIFSYFIYLMVSYTGKIPHTPDAVSYLWQAKYFTSGRLFLQKPPLPEFFPWGEVLKGKWLSSYPFGHPSVLALGVALNLEWVVPATVVTFFFLCLAVLLKYLNFSPLLISILIPLFFFSPFLQMQAVDFMSHNTAALFTIVFLYAFLKLIDGKTQNLLSFIGGLSFGLLYNTRPLTAVSLFPIFSAFTIFYLWKRKIRFHSLFFLLLGGFYILMLYLLYNKILFSNFLISPYYSSSKGDFIWGGGHTFGRGLLDIVSYLLILRATLFTFPSFFIFTIILIPFVFWKPKVVDLVAFLAVIAIALGWSTYGNVWGMFTGARFWYEMVPFLFILFSRGIQTFWEESGKSKLALLLILLLFSWGALRFYQGWLLGKYPLYERIHFTPQKIEDFKTFNFTDTRLIDEAKRQNIHNAVIFVDSCGGWWCYGSVFTQNNITIDGDIVWAVNLGERNKELMKLYPGRKFYKANYDKKEIAPLDEVSS